MKKKIKKNNLGKKNPCHSLFSGGDHLRSTSGIICGLGSFAVQFGDHFRSGDHLRSGIICGAVRTPLLLQGRIMFDLFSSDFKTILKGSSYLGLQSSVFSLRFVPTPLTASFSVRNFIVLIQVIASSKILVAMATKMVATWVVGNDNVKLSNLRF